MTFVKNSCRFAACAIALSFLSACAGSRVSTEIVGSVCPPPIEYTVEEDAQLADEIEIYLPPGTEIETRIIDGIYTQDQLKACQLAN